MAVYSPILKKELEFFLLQYDLGSLIAFEGILEGIENTNYKLETSKNLYILTIFEKRVNPKDLPFFINLKKHLTKKKFLCPEPIQNKDEKYINILSRKYCVINSFLIGKKISIADNNHCLQVGKILALLHQETKDFEGNRDNSMDYEQWKNIFLKSQKIKNKQFNNMMLNIEKELLHLKNTWPKNLPEGVIHGDVFQDNVFFINNQFSGLIDFYFSCNDFFLYDLAITVNAWCFNEKSEFQKSNFLNIIKGYETLRKLTDLEKKHLSTLLRGASLRILITRIHDFLFHPQDAYAEPKNPNEYHLILQFHQKNNLGNILR